MDEQVKRRERAGTPASPSTAALSSLDSFPAFPLALGAHGVAMVGNDRRVAAVAHNDSQQLAVHCSQFTVGERLITTRA